MSVYSLFDIGRNALNAMRTALDVTAHNVANAATPGYHRQEVIFEDIAPGVLISRTTTGRGVRVADVRRLYDSFVAQQLRTESSNKSYWEVFNSYFPKIEAVFNDESGAGLSEPLSDFFSAWQEVAQYPAEYAQRELLLKNGQFLAERIGSAYKSLDEIKQGLFDEASTTVDQINEILGQIAELNRKIALAPGVIDLRDRRDVLLDRLNSLVKVSSFEESNNKVTILLGGVPLLEGELVHELSVSHGADGGVRVSVQVPGGTRDVTAFLSGGKLKALMDLRDRTLKEYMDRLNAFAVNFTQEINARHREGIDLSGKEGADFFSSPVDVVDPASGGVVTSVKVTDPANFSYHRFRIDYSYSPPEDAADFTVTDLSTGQAVAASVTIDPYSMRRVISFSGIEVTIDGELSGNESFEVQINQTAALGVEVSISDPNEVAAASPVYSVDGSNDTLLVDDGTVKTITLPHGVYSGDELAAVLENQLENAVGGGSDFAVTYNPGVKMFRIENSAGNTVSVDILWENSSSTASALFGFSSDTPALAPGNALVSQVSTASEAAAGIPGDNSNAYNLYSVQNEQVVAGRTPLGFYREIVAQVGVDSKASGSMFTFQNAVVEGLEQKMEEVSGVNLDEEAANLIRFQKSFEAAAKMISIADELLGALLNMIGS